MPTIVIIGAGVIGLSCALRVQALLQQKSTTGGWQVLLVSKEWPISLPGAPCFQSANYASMWAGAHVRPIPSTTPQLQREARWLKQTVEEFEILLQQESFYSITRSPGIEFLEDPSEAYLAQTPERFFEETGLRGYRELEQQDLPEGVRFGFEYETFCINSPSYCRTLLRKFILGGGKTLKHDLASEWEAFALVEDVRFAVNATGTGFGDPKSFPTRGQLILTNAVQTNKTVTRQNRDGSWSFIIPRFLSGGTIIGGTKEAADWRLQADANTRKRLLHDGTKLLPYALRDSIPISPYNVEVIADVVARRPTREGGMRIEVEERDIGNTGSGRRARVVHAYGAGGRGYEISWGVANEVVNCLKQVMRDSKL